VRGLRGHLELICAANADGQSFLKRQAFSAPVHLSKPHHDAGTLVVNVVNPTAGLLAGDRIAIDVSVDEGAALLLTTPSATRAHCTGEGYSEVQQEFRVANGAWLEYWPELFIPQGGARYRQKTKISVEAGGGLLFTECIAPGRVASGEAFQFAELAWEMDLFSGSAHVARERYRLTPDSDAVQALRRAFDSAYYASCFLVSPHVGADDPGWERLHALQADDVWIGCGALGAGAWVVKCVARGSVALRRTLATAREELYAAIGRPLPALRRTS
jgi:urease accessory protein